MNFSSSCVRNSDMLDLPANEESIMWKVGRFSVTTDLCFRQ